MENFNFYAPTYFAFGEGRERDIGKLIRRFGGHKVLLHYGGGSVKRNGIYDAAISAMQAEGIPCIELGGVQPNPRSGLVYEGIDLCRKEKVDFILAVGGGSTIDSAKAIAAGVLYDGDFWDYYSKGIPVDQALPVGTVLTISAAGSEGSPDSVITHENGMLKWAASGEALRPKFSVLNPAYTATLPPYQTACGITDIMVHICERYFTNTRDVTVTDYLCEGLLKSVIKEAPKVMENPKNYQARANIMWAGMLAHNDVCGVDREQDWASHNLEHELSSFCDCAHGAGLAVITPAWMDYVCRHDLERFAQFAVQVWGCEMDFSDPERTAREGIRRFRAFLASIGMPGSLSAFGIGEEHLPGIVAHLLSGNPDKTVGRFVPIGAKEAEEIYKSCL